MNTTDWLEYSWNSGPFIMSANSTKHSPAPGVNKTAEEQQYPLPNHHEIHVKTHFQGNNSDRSAVLAE